MKSIAYSSLFAGALLVAETQAALKLSLSKTHTPTTINKRHLLPRQNPLVELLNNITGGSYAAQIAIGNPSQPQNLAIDTGSSDVWFMDNAALRCSDPDLAQFYGGGCASVFDTSRSSSAKMAYEGVFNISYLDGSGASGDYITDDVQVGEDTIKGQIVGIAHELTLNTGIMGIGFSANVASNSGRNSAPFTYPTIVDSMLEQGIIKLKAYSLYLDSKDAEKGSILFGGLDTNKYIGNLFQLPLVPSQFPNGTRVYDHFTVVLTGVSMTSSSGTTNFTSSRSSRYRVPVVLDSGTTLTYLPETTTRIIYREIGAVDTSADGGLVYVDCNLGSDPSRVFTYRFGDSRSSLNIQVPISELLYSISEIFGGQDVSALLPYLPFDNTCAFGIMPAIDGISLLGDTFLRSAYVVYDLENNVVAMAQANQNSSEESIVEFEASATGIPRVSGVAKDVEATQSAIPGVGGPGIATRRPSGASSTDSAPSATGTGQNAGQNAGVRVGSDMSAFVVFGASVAFAVLGGGMFTL